MVDPVVAPLLGVAVAFTKILLRSTNNNLGANIIGDTAGPLAAVSQLVLGKKGSKKQVERAINRDLATRMRNMNERCYREGIDPNRLANPCAEVEAVLDTIGDHKWILEQAVHDPDALRTYFKERALIQRAQVDERLVPYFDELIKAVTEQYIDYAERSPNYLHVAAKQSLKNDKESREATAKIRDAVDGVAHMVAEFASSDSKPSRIVFGSRPDVVGETFVERSEQARLHELVTGQTSGRTVLSGMPGCGKSQLAAALAQRCEEENWSIVAWLNAGSRQSITGELVELAKRLAIDTRDNPTQNQIIRRCLDHLKSADPADRLVVFDNVADISHLTGLVPRGDGLRVVVTSRSTAAWRIQGWNHVKVGVFSREESIDYLLAVTGSQDRETANNLAERLGCLPLAIAQAAATAHNEHWTLQYYFKCLEEYDLARVVHPVQGDSYTQGVACALAMSVDTAIKHLVRGTPGTARRQLGALAVLAESGVPTRWLDPLTDPRNEAELLEADRDVANDAHLTLAELIDRSLVQQTTNKHTTMLHRLQARTIREEWIETQEHDLYDHAAYYLTTVNDPPTGSACSNNQHHVGQHSRDNMEVLGTRAHPDSDELHPVQEKTLGQIRDGLVQISDLSQFEAELRLTKNEIIEQLHAISIQKHSRAQLHRPDVAKVLSDTLEDISYLEMPHKAEKLATAVEYVCATGQRDCGLLPIIRKNYALALQHAGRVHEAVDLYKSILKEEQERTSSHFSITLATRSNLALAYQNSGQTATAITLLEKIVHEDLTTISHDAEISLIIQNSLALAYQNDGRLHDSIPLLEQNLDSYRTLLGEEHHHTQIARNNLAYAYRKLGRFDDSLREFEIALSILKRHQQNHQHTLIVTENYALTLRDKGREENDQEAITTAISTLRDCLERHIDLLSLEHPYTLTARNNLADALLDAGRTEESIELHRFNLREHVRVLGPLHPYSLTIINNLASALFMRCNFSESISLLKCCIREYRRILGPDHHEVLVVRNTLAAAYRESGSYARALDENQLNLSECQRLLSPDAFQFMLVLNNLALTYCRMGKREDAITEFDRILKEYTACYGEAHILVTTVQSMHDAFIADMACFE